MKNADYVVQCMSYLFCVAVIYLQEVIAMERTDKDRKSKNQNKDMYSRVLITQIALSIVAVGIFCFMSKMFPGMKEDYTSLMQWDMSDEAMSAAVYLGEYLSDGKDDGATELTDTTAEDTASKTTEQEIQEETQEITTDAVSIKKTSLEKDVAVQAMASFSDGGMDLYDMPEDYGLSDPEVSDDILCPIESPRYTSYFGYRTNPITGEWSFHTGVDIAADTGTKIRAAYSGKVTKVGEDGRAGKYIFLEHENGLVTFYCHCSEILAVKGANILQGETVALVGSTGWSTGPHVHFEVRKNGEHIDPMKLLEK